MGTINDLTGQRFVRLIVIRRYPENSRNKKAMWVCRCDCGKEIIACGSNLVSGNTNSCGCYQKEIATSNGTTHNMKYTRPYSIWQAMKNRCYNHKDKAYKHYGGRGITICDEWINSFERFWADMQEGYSDELTIERIKVNGNYESNNCKWATLSEQRNNMRSNRIETYMGESDTLVNLCRKFKKNYSTVKSRLNKLGWDINRAMM